MPVLPRVVLWIGTSLAAAGVCGCRIPSDTTAVSPAHRAPLTERETPSANGVAQAGMSSSDGSEEPQKRSRFHWPRVLERFTKPARIPLPRTDMTARLSDARESTGTGDFQ